MQEQFRHCTALVREGDRDRYLATLLAPAEHRDALFALYAFNFEIERVRELAREPMPGEIRLQWWREVVLGERSGEAASNPVAAALLQTLSRYNLPRERLAGFVEAHRFDIYDEPMRSFAELQSYSEKTTVAIFESAVQILGASAVLSGEAGQAQTLANVLMRLPRHAARRQLYVPLEVLRQYGANPEDIFSMRATPELRAALAELRLRARRHLAHIGAASAGIIAARAWPAFLSLAPLRSVLLKMEQVDYDPFEPPQVPPWRRQWQIWRAARNPKRVFG
ncbi:MAG TPA: phytoene/squalene synthase family protein [Pseudolabrys sp.]|nr:phytoene/squalene synthase family protein [Pseudolabrys sp.]